MRRSITILILILGLGMGNAQHEKARDYYNLSEAHVLLHEFQEAINYLDLAIKEDSKYADAYLRRGACYYQLGKNGLAEKDFLMVTKLDPENTDVYFGLGNISSNKNDYKKAEGYYRKIHTINKYAAEKYAKELIKQGTDLYTENMKKVGMKNGVPIENEDIALAFQLIERAVLIDPLDPNHLFVLANYRKNMHQFSGAKASYRKMLEHYPEKVDHASIYFELGEIFHLEKDFDMRDEYFRKSMSGDSYREAYVNLFFMSKIGDLSSDDILDYAQRWNNLLPKQAFPKLFYGMYYADKADYKRAIDHYNEGIALDSNNAQGYGLRARAYYKYAYQENDMEHLYKAYDDFNVALEKGEKTVDNYYGQGQIMFTVYSGEYEETKKVNNELAAAILKNIDAIIALDDKYAHAYQLRASVNYILNGENETADVLNDRALHVKYCPGKH